MVKLSEETIRLLKQDILSILYEDFKKSRFTKDIARELRRDKEFTLKLLVEMRELGWVNEVLGRGALGNRKRWKISEELVEVWRKKED
ncbi:hypothetical protein HYT56_04420 [Candidatus Woesearchaeota archaeon]|nr:hypothetical protein [Candidatus Woesearchaeota archaeon]